MSLLPWSQDKHSQLGGFCNNRWHFCNIATLFITKMSVKIVKAILTATKHIFTLVPWAVWIQITLILFIVTPPMKPRHSYTVMWLLKLSLAFLKHHNIVGSKNANNSFKSCHNCHKRYIYIGSLGCMVTNNINSF